MSSKDYFDQVAPEWDKMRSVFFSESLRDQALKAAGVQAGQSAVDVGAGTGFISTALLAAGLRVTAVDQSQEMLNRLAENLGHLGTIDCLVSNGESIPLPDNTADHALANMYLHHVKSPPAAIREMARVVKPGGMVIITDLDEHNHRFLIEEQHDRWPGFKREDVRKWFEAAGLGRITIDCTGENCTSDSECGSDSAAVSIFIAGGRV